jgi:CheY-like chemotaxis protein
MDPQTLARAVEPFFTTKEAGRGTGLGLSMVHGIAAQSKGAFRLSSELGAGTRAELWLPVALQPAEQREYQHQAVQHGLRSARVLLVDDEEIVRQATAEMLADVGYVVAEADCGLSALRAMDDLPAPDIVITDYKMPGMSGVDLARALRAARPSLPVLLITGFASATDGALTDLPRLAKPFTQGELAARVAELLDR